MDVGNPFLEGNKEGELHFDVVPLPFPGLVNGLFLQGSAWTASTTAPGAGGGTGRGRGRGARERGGAHARLMSTALSALPFRTFSPPDNVLLAWVHGCPFTG